MVSQPAAVARRSAAIVGILAAITAASTPMASQEPARPRQTFRFESRVDLVNVTVTVTDETGRFVPGLQKDDFSLYEDGEPQPISLFFNERVPVSLGIALDTSGSMQGQKYGAARDALERFFGELLDPADEIFLYRFDDEVQLLQGWTTDRRLLRRALGGISPRGATTMYDAVGEAVPLAAAGKHQKKALLVISDGNDTSSRTTVAELMQTIRDTEVLVYAIGIDGAAAPTLTLRPPRLPFPFPPSWPGGGGRRPVPPGRGPAPPQPPPPAGPAVATPRPDARVNAFALRELTDDSGGRTEIIRTAPDLAPATASIAYELSRQYYLGYQSPSAGDGKWHALRVEVRDRDFHVRARGGFLATPPSSGDKRRPCP